MKINKITYEQLFPIPNQQFANVRLSSEIILEEGELPIDGYALGKKEANDAFNKMFPPLSNMEPFYEVGKLYESPSIPIPEHKIEPKQDAEQRMIAAINSCTEVKVLETFKLLVKNNSAFQEAYDLKMKELAK